MKHSYKCEGCTINNHVLCKYFNSKAIKGCLAFCCFEDFMSLVTGFLLFLLFPTFPTFLF